MPVELPIARCHDLDEGMQVRMAEEWVPAWVTKAARERGVCIYILPRKLSARFIGLLTTDDVDSEHGFRYEDCRGVFLPSPYGGFQWSGRPYVVVRSETPFSTALHEFGHVWDWLTGWCLSKEFWLPGAGGNDYANSNAAEQFAEALEECVRPDGMARLRKHHPTLAHFLGTCVWGMGVDT